jgi:hypothetical protein
MWKDGLGTSVINTGIYRLKTYNEIEGLDNTQTHRIPSPNFDFDRHCYSLQRKHK